MVNYSQLNFDQSLDVIEDPEMNELIPGLAVGVNLLGEELQHKVKELKNLNEELEGKNSFIKSVTDAIPEVIYVLNIGSGNVTYVNKCASANSGSPCSNEALAASHACVNCTTVAAILKQQEEGTFSEELNGSEIKMITPNGETTWYKITANDFERDSSGAVVSILHTATDITPLKNKEIQLLKKEDAIIQSLREKELLLQEVHHRVKNNLQIITGLITLQINRAKSPEVISQLTDIRSRIFSISLIHEELYQSDSLARIDVSQYCMRLCDNLAPVYSNDHIHVRFDFDIEPDIFWGIDKATPLGLIINEVICNCYKHAFTGSEKGTISVRFKSTEHHHILSIKDNGESPAAVDVSANGRKTLGGKLISSLVMQLEARLEITTNEGYGVTVIIPKEVTN